MRFRALEDAAEQGVSHDPEIRKRVLLRPGEVRGLTALSRAVFEPGQATTAHRHADMTEVYVVLAGVGVIRVDGQEQPLRAGACIAVEPGELHSVENTGDAPLELLYFGIAR